MSQPIDTAYVEVRPDLDRFTATLDRQITAALNKVQADVDRSTKKVTGLFRRSADKIGEQGGRAGKQFSAGVAAGLAATSVGLQRLDEQIEASARTVTDLRDKIGKSGDLGLIDDLEKADRNLRKLVRQRSLLLGKDDGEESARNFSVGFVGRLGPLLARAPLSPPIVAAIAAGAPAIASTVAAAVTLGVASAAVGGGIVIAFKDPAVKAAGEELVDDLGGMLTRAAKPFVPETIKGIAIVRRELLGIEDDLTAIFGDSSRYVQPLARGIGGFVRELAPGLSAAVRNAEPLIDLLSNEHLPALGRTLGDAFERLSKNSENTRVTLDAVLTTLEGMVATTSKIIEISTSDVGQIFTGSWIAGLVSAAGGGTKVLKDMSNSTRDVAASMATATDVARSFREQLNAITNASLSAEQAEITWAQSVRTTTAAIKENSTAIANKNERDLANRQLLVDMAQVGMRRVDAIREETEATQGAAAAETAAAQVYATTRAELVRAATAYLGSAEAAEKYVTEVLGIPPSRTTVVNADTAAAAQKLRTVGELIAAIKSKRVVITTVTRSEGRNVPIGEGVGGRQHGGPVAAGRAYVVGEVRPELFVPDVDGTILPSVPGERTVAALNALLGGTRPPRSATGGVREAAPAASAATVATFDEERLARVLARAVRAALVGTELRMTGVDRVVGHSIGASAGLARRTA